MNTIKIRRIVETEIPLLRSPTDKELEMIKNDEMFDIDGLFDWEKENTIDEDYSFCQIKLQSKNNNILIKHGGYVRIQS